MSPEALRLEIERHNAVETADLDFARAVLHGLSQKKKTIPSRYLYDARGSELFEEITKLPEYYPTRTETGILRTNAAEIAERTPDGSVLIEFGSGSSIKTELLLAALPSLFAYVPIDISPTTLVDANERLSERFPSLRVVPVVGDFSKPISLDDTLSERPRVGFFPGSTIGNLLPEEAKSLLTQMAELIGKGGRLIIGADLKKDEDTLVAAYSDAAGVTAEFNFNLLARLNRELGADFDTDAFEHLAKYNADFGRMESHLVSKTDQTVSILNRQISFAANESIHTENSHKYDLEGFADLAASSGWKIGTVWTDAKNLFSVHELIAT